jgi:hypothetical protein
VTIPPENERPSTHLSIKEEIMKGTRTLLGLVLTSAVAALGLTGVAQARATIERFVLESEFSETTTLPECLAPDLVGTVSGTERTEWQIVDTGTTVHAPATTTQEYRVDFPDGRYVVGTATEHFTFSTRSDMPLVSTTTIVEPRTIYDADGNPVGRVMVHFTGHITAFDANGDQQFSEDEIVTNRDFFFFTCG